MDDLIQDAERLLQNQFTQSFLVELDDFRLWLFAAERSIELEKENAEMREVFQNFLDEISSEMEFSDPRISYETWQITAGEVQKMREYLAKFPKPETK